MHPSRVNRLGLSALALALLTLLVISYFSFVNWRRFREASEMVPHIRQVLAANDSLLAHVVDAETGQRGFLLTNRPDYLEPYHSAVQAIYSELDELTRLTHDYPEQSGRVQTIRSLVDVKLGELRDTIELRRTVGLDAALAVVRTDLGRHTMTQLRDAVSDLAAHEDERRQTSWADLESDAATARWLTLLESFLLAGLVIPGALMLGRAAQRQESLTEAAASARDLLYTTLHSIGDGVISTDAQGRITFLNPVAERLTGFSGAEAQGRPIEEVFRIANEETRATVDNPVRRVLREGQVVGLANHTVLVSRGGFDVPVDDSGAPIRSRDGKLEGAVLVFRDVTARRKAEEELRLSERRFRTVADSAPVMICSDDANGLRDYCNLPWLQFTGRTLEQELGHGWHEGIHPDDRTRAIEIFERVFRDRQPLTFEFRLRKSDGQYAWVLGRKVPRFGSEGGFLGYIGSYTDIDDRRRAEERMRHAAKLESLGVLAGGIAHDFNNLLVAIMGNASLLEDEIPPGAPAREMLDSVIKASERAAMLTSQILAYSGQGRFVVEPLDLSEQVRQITALLQASLAKNVEVRLDLAAGLPLVEADASQIQQLIMNLVVNAAEAVGPGSGLVEVVTGDKVVDAAEMAQWVLADNVQPGRFVVLTVIDNGIGMDAQTQARIFDPFFTTKFTGRGLGLAAALGITRGHGGGIKLVSAPGEGTTFQIFLPAAAVAGTSPSPVPCQPFRGTGCILVVDDEDMVREAARHSLERAGYTPLVASSGAEAVELLSGHAAEVLLILLDMTMPGLSGEETLERLRSIRANIPIVISSGYSELVAQRRFGNRIDGFLQKPYTVTDFGRVVQTALSFRKQTGAAT
jgi:PAS domain S-box-containing protein